MARPKRRWSAQHMQLASDAADYFNRMFEKESKYLGTTIVETKAVSAATAQREAREALEALPSLARFDYDAKTKKRVARSPEDTEASLAAFRAWTDKFVTDVGWSRCLSNLRQVRHRKPGAAKFTSLKIPFGTHYGLKRWAAERSLTLNDALLELLKIANAKASNR